MKTIEVPLTAGFSVEMDIEEEHGHFVMHRPISGVNIVSETATPMRRWWTVAHAPSGFRVITVSTKKDARKVMRWLENCDEVDWDSSEVTPEVTSQIEKIAPSWWDFLNENGIEDLRG